MYFEELQSKKVKRGHAKLPFLCGDPLRNATWSSKGGVFTDGGLFPKRAQETADGARSTALCSEETKRCLCTDRLTTHASLKRRLLPLILSPFFLLFRKGLWARRTPTPYPPTAARSVHTGSVLLVKGKERNRDVFANLPLFAPCRFTLMIIRLNVVQIRPTSLGFS